MHTCHSGVHTRSEDSILKPVLLGSRDQTQVVRLVLYTHLHAEPPIRPEAVELLGDGVYLEEVSL